MQRSVLLKLLSPHKASGKLQIFSLLSLQILKENTALQAVLTVSLDSLLLQWSSPEERVCVCVCLSVCVCVQSLGKRW